MKKIKTWDQLNELHTDTYRDAALKSNKERRLDTHPNLKKHISNLKITKENFWKAFKEFDTADYAIEIFDHVYHGMENSAFKF